MYPGFAVTAFSDSSDRILYWEAEESAALSGVYAWNDGSSYPSEEGLATRHYTGANVGLLDGHVQWMSQADFTAQQNASPGMLWFNPLSASGH